MARVQTARKSTTGSVCYGRGELSPFCNGIPLVVDISRPVASGGQVEKLLARAKIPVFKRCPGKKMEGACVKTGLEQQRSEVNVQIHIGDLMC